MIEPKVYEDSRGFFYESFNLNKFKKETSLDVKFVQDNHSRSVKGVLRGLHYQLPPNAQGKLVRVVHGEVLDIAVDIRRSSKTFGHHVSCILSSANKRQLWIPVGFAHGFLTLSDTADFVYKTTDFFNANNERCILFNDKFLNIDWGLISTPILSSKDLSGNFFLESELFP